MRQMNVNPATSEGELVGDEDDISEPDEDSYAGQMALLKGQAVKSRLRNDDDDDTSGTEESDADDDSDSDSD